MLLALSSTTGSVKIEEVKFEERFAQLVQTGLNSTTDYNCRWARCMVIAFVVDL